MVAAAMIQSGLLQTPRVQSPSFTSRRPARSACKSVCRASNHQVIKPIKTASGVAAFVLSAAAAMQLIASPPAEAIATQTDMYARPQMSDSKTKTGQPEQSKDPLEPGSGAIASDPAREQKKLPKGEQAAADDSRMTRSSSGAIARGPGGKAMK